MCMVVHSYYPSDARVKRESELLVRNGVAVDVLCLRNKSEIKRENVGGVNVTRLGVRRHRGAPVLIYLLEYFMFISYASFILAVRCIRNRYEVLQFHNPPDYIVFAGFFPKLLGVKIVLDMHEIVPELFMNRWGLEEGSMVVWVTKWLEKISIALSNKVMTVSDPVKEVIESRTGRKNITIVMNVADDALFRPVGRGGHLRPDLTLISYHGIVAPWYNISSVIRAISRLSANGRKIRFDVFGDGPDFETLNTMVRSSRLSPIVFLHGMLPIEDIKREVEQSDIGVVPLVNRKYYADLAMPTKLLELAALGIPAIVPRLPIIERYFDDAMVQYYDADDEDDLRKKLEELVINCDLRASISSNVKKFSNRYSWENQGKAYLEMLEDLARGRT